MATTTVKTKTESGKEQVLIFMTAPKPEGQTGIDVDIFMGNDAYEPIGRPSLGIDLRTEEVYHKELRKQASERGEFIPEASTNPEWNPGYVEPEEQEPDNGTI